MRIQQIKCGLSPWFYSFIWVCLASSLCAQPWSGVISSSRGYNWASAGVSGGIPSSSWTQCGSTIPSTASAATINSAISACGPNTYVQLAAGTFNLNNGITVSGQSNVAIRGMGANQTILVFSGQAGCWGQYGAICFQSSAINWNDGPANGPVNWTAGYSQGATTITLASAPNLVVGQPIILDQLDSTSDIGSILESASTTGGNSYKSPGSPGPYSLQGDNGEANRAGRGQVQITSVTSCNGVSTPGAACSGSNVSVGISPGLIMPTWSSSLSPQAWWGSGIPQYVGVENLTINATNDGATGGNGYGVEFFNVQNGWVKGVETIGTSRGAVGTYLSDNITIRDSYFFLAQFSASTSYGFECYTSSNDLVENNIFEAIAGPLTIDGSCEGTVLGYNYATMGFYTDSSGWAMPTSNSHGVNTDYDLYEGNVGSQVNGDVFHGSHNMDTLFRNYWSGTYPSCWISGSSYTGSTYGTCTGDLVAINLLSFSRYFNIIGNVLGTPGLQMSYKNGNMPVVATGGGAAGDIPGTSTLVTVPNDPVTTNTAMFWGNWDSYTNAVRWCGNSSNPGWSTTCGSTSEIPTGDAFYPQPVPSSTTLPASFYYSSQPSWWPSGIAWPPIGPDVSGGNLANTGGHANMIPAENCFISVMGGSTTGGKGPYSFNASTCYLQQTTTTQPPAPPVVSPPTSLTAVAN